MQISAMPAKRVMLVSALTASCVDEQERFATPVTDVELAQNNGFGTNNNQNSHEHIGTSQKRPGTNHDPGMIQVSICLARCPCACM